MEDWFAQLERRSLYRGVFTSVTELKREIERFIKVHNKELAKPFRRTKDAATIIGAVERATKVLPNKPYCPLAPLDRLTLRPIGFPLSYHPIIARGNVHRVSGACITHTEI